jgi:hypothetical protein
VRRHTHVEKGFEVAEILVVGPEEGLDGRLRDGDLTRRCRWDSRISLSYSSLPAWIVANAAPARQAAPAAVPGERER